MLDVMNYVDGKDSIKKNQIGIARVGCEANLFKHRAFKLVTKLFNLKIVCATDKVNEKLKSTIHLLPPLLLPWEKMCIRK